MLYKYTDFLNEKLNNTQEKYLSIILKYINKKTNIELYEYYEDFNVRKKGQNFTGKLYFLPNHRAIRFNFKNTLLHSIDIWDYFEFDSKKVHNKPSYTMILKDTVINVLDKIIDFIKGDFKVNENRTEEKVDYEKASFEDVQLQSILISKEVFEEDIDVFEAMKLYTMQVAYGLSNALIVTGAAGLGKSYEITEAIKSLNIPYQIYKGDVSTSGLYEVLFLNREKLIVFDDCDSVWKDQDSINLLKAALDTHKVREVSRALKTHFNSEGMSDKEIWKTYKETGKLPKQFEFSGRIIFISNLKGKDIDKAIVSRSLHIDINLTTDQIIKRLTKLRDAIFAKVSKDIRDTTFDFLIYILKNYKTKFDLNIRTMIHAMNIRLGNDRMTTIAGKQIPLWQMLIKSYLIEK